jgi:hypothetical protein
MSPHLLACLLCLPGQATVDELLAQHEATMAKVQSLAVECDYFHCQPGEIPKLSYQSSAARDAGRTRTRSAQPAARTDDGQNIGIVTVDLLEDARGVRLLENWDERTGSPIADSDGIRAELIAAGTRRHPWVVKPEALLLQQVQPAGSEVWDVSAYLRANGSAKVLPEVQENGRRLIPVAVDHPKFGTLAPGTGIKSTLYFAPDAGGLILKQAHDIPPSTGAVTAPVRQESTALQLQELQGGLVLPRTIRYTLTDLKPGSKPHVEMLIRVTSLQVNEQVPDAALAFRFPAGILVKDYTQPGGVLVHRWGEDDQPAETWVDQPPAWAFTLARVIYGLNAQTLSFSALALALACGTAWYLIRRQRRRQQTAVTS